MRFILFLLLMVAAQAPALAQRHYICYYTAVPPVIDGKGDEALWQRASWTEDFVDILGDRLPKPPLRTRMKMLWDSVNLYLYTELEEPNLWGTLTQHDAVIYRDNDFEVFIDPDDDTQNYFELEFNSLGKEMDLFLPKPYRNGGRPLLSWDAQGLKSAVHTRGTMNRPGDKDQGWSVEMAIPLKSLHLWGDRPTGDGDRWRINFSRVEWDLDIKDGKYSPQMDSAGKRKPEHNWVWAPQGAINMHMPERWGYLQFSTHAGGADTIAFVPPADEQERSYLWQVYNRQQEYRKAHGRYAVSGQELGVTGEDSGHDVKIEGVTRQFTATIGELSIDQDGKITHHP